MITPTIGRVVWVQNRPGRISDTQPEVALICYVHSDICINVAGFDHDGNPFRVSSCTLQQEDASGDVPDYGPAVYAQWMPYQKGQAAKTEALEAAAAQGATSGSAG